MSSAELLLRKLLDDAGGGAETGFMLVIDGEGLQDLPASMSLPSATWGVHRATTELGLRHLLWKAQGAPLIAVLPQALAEKVQRSPDLLRRASRQRVHALSINDVLEVVLGVRVVGADTEYLQKLALAHVDKLGHAMSQRTLPTVVDRRLLQELLVDASVGERVRRQTPGELLAAWAKETPKWAESPDIRRLLADALPVLHGDEGRLLSWATADAGVRMAELVVHGAVLSVDAEDVPKPAWGPLWRAAAEPPLEMDRRLVRRAAVRLAESALDALGDAATELLVRADRVARAHLVPSDLATSRVLPLAFADRGRALAKLAASGKPVSSAELAWLASHRAAGMHSTELAVLEAMGRLSRWLDEPDGSAEGSAEGSTHGPTLDVVAQVEAYQRSSAFADLALSQLRHALASSVSHHEEAGKLATAARARRDRENRRFAEALAGGYEACLHRDGLTPLHRIWKRTVAPVWQAEPAAKLFLVVLDGCSYAVFLDLLLALSQDGAFPMGIRPDATGRVAGLPAVAPLPTVTSHARGAIFLGELPKDPLVAETVFRDQQEAKTDKARFAQNAALGTRTRRLFLKGDLTDGGQALRAALSDAGIGVVAVVFNAIDDQIGSSNTGATVRLRPEDIDGFKPALQVALKAGRKVLLTADHGHSPFVDNSLRMGSGSAPRYLALGPGDAAPEGFLEIDVAGLGGPPERRAFAFRPGAYLGGQQVGFHGGASLEEVVVPLAWIERDGMQADEPSWWFGRGALAERSVETRPIPLPIVTPVPSDPIPAKPKPQLSLFEPADKAAALPIPAVVLESLSKDERSILVLLRDNTTATASELADRLQKNAGRLNGLMVTLRRKLHAAGLILFSDERLPTGETMYRYLAKEPRP